MRRGYKKPYKLRGAVVTCWNCGALVHPEYEIVSGTGKGPNGELAPRRKKSSRAPTELEKEGP